MECASTACQMITSALRMKNTEVRWSWMNAPWEKMLVQETVSIIRRIRQKGEAMGLTDCQKEMIRAVAENDIRKAKQSGVRWLPLQRMQHRKTGSSVSDTGTS